MSHISLIANMLYALTLLNIFCKFELPEGLGKGGGEGRGLSREPEESVTNGTTDSWQVLPLKIYKSSVT